MLTLPFGAGVVAAFVFVLFELVVVPVLMHATTTCASFSVFNSATKGKPLSVRSIKYPLWNEGLFIKHKSHVALFFIRVLCLSIPVYLETRFISQSNRPMVSKLLPYAYVPEPKDFDVRLSLIPEHIFDSYMFPTDLCNRCAEVDEHGWLLARIVNVTVLKPDRRRIQCMKDTDQIVYRNLQRIEPFQQVVVDGVAHSGPSNVSFEVRRDEGLFKAFRPWAGIESHPDTQFVQLKNITVLNAKGLECSFWRAPLVKDQSTHNEKDCSFICQNATGKIVDFFFVSMMGLLHEGNAHVLHKSSDGNLVSMTYTVSAEPQFIGSLEFRGNITVNSGNFVRQHWNWTPNSTVSFASTVRTMLYTTAENLTVWLPGNEEEENVQLDNVVIVVGSGEVVLILALGMVVEIFSRLRWSKIQRINTVDGLSRCWQQVRAGLQDGKDNPVTLQLTERKWAGAPRPFYHPV